MATRRLLCIPCAGAGALAFRGWSALLPAHIEAYALQLPAREDRLREPPLDAWAPMMAAVVDTLTPLPPMPTAIFGHSLGALIGLDIARRMEAGQPGRLAHLFVAGRPWPGNSASSTDPDKNDFADLAGMPDDALLEALDRCYGSLSTSLSHPEIREATLPTLRADLRLLASYRHAPRPALPCPLTVIAGGRDPATPAALIAGWRNETQGSFRVHTLADAQHFFVESHRAGIVACIADRLATDACSSALRA